MTDTTGIVVDIGAPSLTGKYADQLVRDAFAGVTYPLWVIVTNHLEANVSLPEVDGLFLRPISTASANYALVEVSNADQLQQLAASMEQVAISNNSPLAISLNEVPNYGHPVATPTNLNIVPPSMPEPSSHIVPIKTINGVSILGYGDVALDIIDTGAKIDDAAGAGALTVVWSAHKIDEAIKTHTHSNYAPTTHNHDADYADITHTHTIAIADVTGLSDALESVTPASGTNVSTTSTATLTNKTISMANNSLTGTTAEFNAALSDGDFCTLDGTETLTNKTITGLVEKHAAIAVAEIDLKTGNLFSKTISGAITLSLKNVPASGSVATFILELTNAGTNVTWWAGLKWQKGTSPTLTAAGTDVLGFYSRDGGASWTGFVMAKDVK